MTRGTGVDVLPVVLGTGLMEDPKGHTLVRDTVFVSFVIISTFIFETLDV